MAKRFTVITCGLCIKMKIRGNARLIAPLKRGFIVAANHLNGADSFVLQVALLTRFLLVVSRNG